MDRPKKTLTESVLARISLGAVPMGGFYWFDPREVTKRGAQHECRSDRDELNRTRPQAGRGTSGEQDRPAVEGPGGVTVPRACL